MIYLGNGVLTKDEFFDNTEVYNFYKGEYEAYLAEHYDALTN